MLGYLHVNVTLPVKNTARKSTYKKQLKLPERGNLSCGIIFSFGDIEWTVFDLRTSFVKLAGFSRGGTDHANSTN